MVGHLYPDYLNIYADRGNIAVLERRCAWRSIGFEVTGIGLGDPVPPDVDLLYVGGARIESRRSSPTTSPPRALR